MKTARPAFLRAAQSGDIVLMRLPAGERRQMGHPDGNNTTALMVASGIGWVEGVTYEWGVKENLEAVKLLLELGADVNAVDGDGRTALHGAAHKDGRMWCGSSSGMARTWMLGTVEVETVLQGACRPHLDTARLCRRLGSSRSPVRDRTSRNRRPDSSIHDGTPAARAAGQPDAELDLYYGGLQVSFES
jgi:hypothetical protein